MNVKINDKQKSHDPTTKERRPMFDENKFLTNCWVVALDEIFSLTKISCSTVRLSCEEPCKVFLLHSLKFKVAPYPKVVTLNTLKRKK